MKCQDCRDLLCENKFEKRNKCAGTAAGGSPCTCFCQVTKRKRLWGYGSSVVAGCAMITSGVSLTDVEDNVLAMIGGVALIGSGSHLLITAIRKSSSGEYLTLKDCIIDSSIGALTGATAISLKHYALTFSNRTSDVLMKHVIRTGAYAAGGGAGGATLETARCLKGEQVTYFSYARSIGIGVFIGTFASVPSQIESYREMKRLIELSKVARKTKAAAAEAMIDHQKHMIAALEQKAAKAATEVNELQKVITSVGWRKEAAIKQLGEDLRTAHQKSAEAEGVQKMYTALEVITFTLNVINEIFKK